MNGQYILVDGEPVEEFDLIKWGRFMQSETRKVALDEVGGIKISTVFLGLDHSFGGWVPVLWGTMIFGGKHDQYQERYTTKQKALEGHAKAVALVKSGE